MRLRAHTIREQWADRILRIAIHLRTTAKLVQAAKLEVLEGYTGQVIIIINEGEESTLVFSTQTKNRAIAAEQAINNTKEGHPTSCSINTMTRCLVRLAKGSLSPSNTNRQHPIMDNSNQMMTATQTSSPNTINNSTSNVISLKMANRILVCSNSRTTHFIRPNITNKMATTATAITSNVTEGTTSKTLMTSTITKENRFRLVEDKICLRTNTLCTNSNYNLNIVRIYSSQVCNLQVIFRTTILTMMKMTRATPEVTNTIKIILVNTISITIRGTILSKFLISPKCQA